MFQITNQLICFNIIGFAIKFLKKKLINPIICFNIMELAKNYKNFQKTCWNIIDD